LIHGEEPEPDPDLPPLLGRRTLASHRNRLLKHGDSHPGEDGDHRHDNEKFDEGECAPRLAMASIQIGYDWHIHGFGLFLVLVIARRIGAASDSMKVPPDCYHPVTARSDFRDLRDPTGEIDPPQIPAMV
jgi:hypothetical protein